MRPTHEFGTPDRISRYHGKRYVTDLKTGSIEFGFGKIAAQLAMYARSRPYDVETGKRMEPHGADLEQGIVIHLPAGEATCTLYWIDLLAGWEIVQLCRRVREKRALKFDAVFSPVGGPNANTTPLPAATETATLAEQIHSAATPEAIRELWREHATTWTDELTQLAKTHINQLEGANA